MNTDRKKKMKVSFTHICVYLCLSAPIVFSTGCSRGPRNFDNENDRLRKEVLDLKSQIQTLESRAAAAERQLEIEKQARPGPALPEGINRPVVTRVSIARPSRGVDEDKNGHDEVVRLYLETYDARGRFLTTHATVKVTAAAVAAGQPAVTVATKEFDATTFDQSYRSGLAGTHYTLLVPLTAPVPKGVEQLTVSIELTDLLTGAVHKAEKIVNVTP